MLPLRTVAGLTVLALAGCALPQEEESAPRFVDATAPASETATASETPPAPTTAATSRRPSATPKTKTPTRYVFPVRASNVAFHPTHGKYPATDIFADCGAPVVAATGGVILETSLVDKYVEGSPDGPANGGLSVSLLGDDGVRYYGSHFSAVRSGIRAGVRVSAGQQLGKVGRTGNASGVCHLHFGISPPCARVGDWKVRRGVVWPAEFLTSWRAKGGKSPVATVASWRKAHDCEA